MNPCIPLFAFLSIIHITCAQTATPTTQSKSTLEKQTSPGAPPAKVQYVAGAVNVAPDLILPAETLWNHFSPEFIPEFTIPEQFDPVIGSKVPVKTFIWHQPGRNMFQNGKETTDAERWENERKSMFRHGITSIVWTAKRPDDLLPRREGPLKTSPLNPGTQLAVGLGTVNDDAFRSNWTSWIDWWQKSTSEYAGQLNTPQKDGKASIFLTLPDYESTYTHANDQQAANYLVVGNYAMLEKSAGYVGQMYLGPTNTLGIVTPELYTGGSKTHAWFNAADQSVPEAYRGKKIEGNPRIVAGLEVSHYYETWVPEGTVLKDQHNKDWIKITHFGKQPTAEHWAARVGGNIEAASQYTQQSRQKLLAQLKVTADRQSGFQYSPDFAQSHEGKWIKEFNRYGAIHPGPNNTEFTGSIGSEVMPNFMAEAQIALAYFSGADGINFWGSSYSSEFHPSPRSKESPQRGEKHSDPKYGRVDREPYNYVLKALWRLNQKVTLENGEKISFFDICDGTEEYLNWHTNVSYDSEKTFKEARALDWQFEKLTAVRAVINRRKKVVFVMAFQPYGVEQKQVTFKLNEGMYLFKKSIAVPPGKVVICAYKAPGLSSASPVKK